MASSDDDTVARERVPLSRVLVPVGIIVFCAIAFWLTTQFDRVPPILKRGIQPSDFPQLMIGLIAMLAASLIFIDRDDSPEALPKPVWVTLAGLVGFVLVAEVDLFIGLGLFAVFLAFAWGERRPWSLSLVGFIVPAGVFLLFDIVFEIRFPRGILTSLWYG